MTLILVIDDDPQGLDSTRRTLELAGYSVLIAVNGQEALQVLRSNLGQISLVVSDVRMPQMGGLDFLRALILIDRSIPAILMTAYGSIEDAVWAMKLGAVDFLTKPFKRQALLDSVEGALKRAGGQKKTPRPQTGTQLIGQSEAMNKVRSLIAQVAPTGASVLLSGESGTGKELVAKAIHEQSARAKGPFIALNCAALPESLIESELFGYEKGAFTGAATSRQGLFEAANGGTLLLDEIGDMPLILQTKLLRVLQESEVRRVGSNQSRKIHVRVIAATHRNLRDWVAEGKFRQDLFFRLEVVQLTLPPLRDRAQDVAELAHYFLKQSCLQHGKNISLISESAMARLIKHSWPGNIRELANVIERAVVFCNDAEIGPSNLPEHLAQFEGSARGEPSISVRVGTSLKEVEDLLIRKTLEATDGDKNMTAKILGINSRTIYRKLNSP